MASARVPAVILFSAFLVLGCAAGTSSSPQRSETSPSRSQVAGPPESPGTAALQRLSDPDAELSASISGSISLDRQASSTLFASADGEPVALDLRYSVPATELLATSDLRLSFEPSRTPRPIAPPEDPWVTKAAGHGYTMHPEAWDTDFDPADGDFTDVFSGPEATVKVYCRPHAGLSLEAWSRDGWGITRRTSALSRTRRPTR